MPSDRLVLKSNSVDVASAQEGYERLLRDGGTPEIARFLDTPPHDRLSPEDALAVIRIDQRSQWMSGEEIDVVWYFQAFPWLKESEEFRFELIYNELLIREELGQAPVLEEYEARFPELAERLRLQLEVHGAFAVEIDENRDDDEESDRVGALPQIKGYDVLNEIGRGGMAVVYEARQHVPPRVVALKMILHGRFASSHERIRFRNETGAVAALDHPNIVPILEAGEFEGIPYFTMRLLPGGSLADHGGPPRDDPRKAARLVQTIAGAVHHAHQRGFLHRDLKPSNILIDEQGRPYVSDFGLAKRLEAKETVTLTGHVIGSPGYMAPEQADGDMAAVTTATDVYGLGAILYSLLTGRAPIAGTSIRETLQEVRTRVPEPPSALNRKVPRPLEVICLKCLDKEPSRRYASAAELAEDLRRWLDGEPITARPVGRVARLRLWAGREPIQAVLALGLIAAVTTGIAVGASLWYRAELRAAALAQSLNREKLASNEAIASADRERIANRYAQESNQRAQRRLEVAIGAIKDYFGHAVPMSLLRDPESAAAVNQNLVVAETYYRRLLDSFEGDKSPEGRAEVARAYFQLGWTKVQLRLVDQAIPNFDQAVKTYEDLVADGERREALFGLASTLFDVGVTLRSSGEAELAVGRFDRARSIYLEMLRRSPDDREAEQGYLWSLQNLASAQRDIGELEEALKIHRQALVYREALVEEQPLNHGYRRDRGTALLDVGLSYSLLGQGREAVRYIRASVDELTGAVERAPVDGDAVARLKGALYLLSRTYRGLGERKPMLDAMRLAIAESERLVKIQSGPSKFSLGTTNSNSISDRIALADLHREYAWMIRSTGDAAEAGRELQKGIVIYESVKAENPKAFELITRLAGLHGDAVNHARAEKNPAKASESGRQAAAMWRTAASLQPQDELTRVSLADSLLDLVVDLCEAGGDDAKIHLCMEEADVLIQRLKTRSGDLFYLQARAHASIYPRLSDPSQREARAKKVVAALWRASRTRQIDPARPVSDPVLAPLADRADFQVVLAYLKVLPPAPRLLLPTLKTRKSVARGGK